MTQKRFIVTNPYPNTELKVGDIVRFIPNLHQDEYSFVRYYEQFKANFRELSWWEYRDESKMPEYLESLEIFPNHHWVKVTNHFTPSGFFESVKDGNYWEARYMNYKPSTLEAYTAYINSKKS